MSFRILGTGSFVPERAVTNAELSVLADTSDEWIRKRVGVCERRVCTTETTAEMGYRAAASALEQARVRPDDIDMILCATVSGDTVSPSAACVIQKKLGAGCPAMDINAACSGFIYMLDTAAGFFARRRVKKMLVIGAERLSKLVDWSDRGTCVIFGDAAGAAVLGEGDCYIASKLFARGNDSVIRVPAYHGSSPFYSNEPEHPYIHMNGQETFKFAVGAMAGDLLEVFELAGVTAQQIAWVIPHQANLRIIEAAVKKTGVPPERFCTNIERYGNTSAASIPLLLDEVNRERRLKNDDLIALTSFGAGLSSAACVIRWSAESGAGTDLNGSVIY